MMRHRQRSHNMGRHGIADVFFFYHRAMFYTLILCVALITGCASGQPTAGTGKPKPTRTPQSSTPTPPAFSQFPEWRAAYIAANRQLHAITFDGKYDDNGPYVPNSPDAQDQTDWRSAGFSSDGHYLAFQAPDFTILDVTRRNAITPIDPTLFPWEMAWSPQGDTLAVQSQDIRGYVLIDAATGQVHHVPGTSSSSAPGSALTLVGWIDSAHLAVTLWPSDDSSFTDPAGDKFALANPLGSLDITTGAVRPIATITSPAQASTSRFVLSPDGTRALYYNVPFRHEPFTPVVDLVDIATGQITSLPRIAQTAKATFTALTSVAWRPGSDSVAASLFYSTTFEAVLLDVRRDTITPLIGRQFVEAWTPDAKTLILSSDWQHLVGIGPHTISALTLAPNGQTSLVVLTHDAYTSPFVGFVRTQ